MRDPLLLLDDDPSMQRLVSKVLETDGDRVDAFLTGRDAIAGIGKNDDTVLTGSPGSVIEAARDEIAGLVKHPFEPPRLVDALRGIVEL